MGLGATLAPGTRLPAPPSAAEAPPEVRCPGGLPPLEADAPIGQLRPDVLVQSLGPLRQGAAICVSTAQGPGAAGGRVVLAMRIGPDGSVTDACAVEDETGDPRLLDCLRRSARAVAFPAPSPPGHLDVQLPLVLAPEASQRQRPVCR